MAGDWKSVAPEGFANKTSLKQWSRRCRLVAGAKDDRFKTVLEWAEAWEPTATTVAQKRQHSKGNAARAALVREHVRKHRSRKPTPLSTTLWVRAE